MEKFADLHGVGTFLPKKGRQPHTVQLAIDDPSIEYWLGDNKKPKEQEIGFSAILAVALQFYLAFENRKQLRLPLNDDKPYGKRLSELLKLQPSISRVRRTTKQGRTA